MSDSYLNFSNRPLGRRLVRMLGLPNPLPLERHVAGSTVVDGDVLVGGTANAQLIESLAPLLKSVGATVRSHSQLDQWPKIAAEHKLVSEIFRGEKTEKVKALVFDASGLTDSAQSDSLYQFFHETGRALSTCGRVVILGRPPESCADPRAATIQRALEGLTRSLGKEFRKGITCQLVYVGAGAESNMESTLRFLLSPRSTYVSGQVIRIDAAVGDLQNPLNWDQPLHGKNVLVTGASRGIGAAIAETMSSMGSQMTVLDIPQADKELAVVAASLQATSLALDITADDAPQQLLDHAGTQGGWDVIVHNAGITRDRRIVNMKAHYWQQVVEVNLSAPERISDVLLQGGAINRNGRVVCVSSISGIAGNMGQTNYALSKAGVIGMVQSNAEAFAKKGVTINAVAPGFIETQMTAAVPLMIREAGRRMNSQSQGGLPVDVAQTIAWLASPASAGINGNVVRVCGQSLLGA